MSDLQFPLATEAANLYNDIVRRQALAKSAVEVVNGRLGKESPLPLAVVEKGAVQRSEARYSAAREAYVQEVGGLPDTLQLSSARESAALATGAARLGHRVAEVLELLEVDELALGTYAKKLSRALDNFDEATAELAKSVHAPRVVTRNDTPESVQQDLLEQRGQQQALEQLQPALEKARAAKSIEGVPRSERAAAEKRSRETTIPAQYRAGLTLTDPVKDLEQLPEVRRAALLGEVASSYQSLQHIKTHEALKTQFWAEYFTRQDEEFDRLFESYTHGKDMDQWGEVMTAISKGEEVDAYLSTTGLTAPARAIGNDTGISRQLGS